MTAARYPVAVVIPTYNERDNLPVLIHKLFEFPDLAAIVVDDNSPDGTGAVADRLGTQFPGRVTVLHRSAPDRGFGTAYLAGIATALTTGAELIVQMDGDLSHDPAYLPAMRTAAGSADLGCSPRTRKM